MEKRLHAGRKTHHINAHSNYWSKRNKVTICSEEQVEHLVASQDCVLLFNFQILNKYKEWNYELYFYMDEMI